MTIYDLLAITVTGAVGFVLGVITSGSNQSSAIASNKLLRLST